MTWLHCRIAKANSCRPALYSSCSAYSWRTCHLHSQQEYSFLLSNAVGRTLEESISHLTERHILKQAPTMSLLRAGYCPVPRQLDLPIISGVKKSYVRA